MLTRALQLRPGLLAAALAFASAVPAAAQPKGKAPLSVTDWAPTSGPVGTEVTLRGTGLNQRGTVVLVGGNRVTPRRVGRDFLTLEIPRRPGDGRIVLRHPDMADDLAVGTFDVMVVPRIASISPRSGAPGTRIELRGSGFHANDSVFLNERPLDVLERSERRLVVALPQDATTGVLTVARPGGPKAEAPTPFRVVQPPPTISSFEPGTGAGGTRVRLHGEHFQPGVRVLYGDTEMTVAESSETQLVVIVPVAATRDEFFAVETSNGRARSPARFSLELPPVVRSIAPKKGPPGTALRIAGRHFAPGDKVLVGDRVAQTVQLTERSIVATVPPDAASGPVAVVRGQTRTTDEHRFQVVYAPQVDQIEPLSGGAGTLVVVRGRHFARDVKAYLGSRRLRLVEYSDDKLAFRIPRGAKSARVRIATGGGDATGEQPLTVYRYATVRAVRPRTVARGASLTIRGRDFAEGDQFWLGDAALPVVSSRPTQVVVTVPDKATSARLAWASHGKRFANGPRVTVLEPPSIESIAPAAGPPGVLVTLRGAHFTARARVRWGETRVPVVRRAAGSLTVRVPRRASGSAYFHVRDAGGTAVSPTAFRVERKD